VTELSGDLRGVELLLEKLEASCADSDDLNRQDFGALVAPTFADTGRAETLAASLTEVRTQLDQSLGLLTRRLRDAGERRRAEIRFTRDGVKNVLTALETRPPAKARRRWVAELSAALAGRESVALELLLARPVGVVPEVRDSLSELAAGIRDDGPQGRLAVVEGVRRLFPTEVQSSRGVRFGLIVTEAQASRDAGDTSRAREILDEECARSRDPRIHAERAFLLVSLGDYAEAQAAAAQAAELAPSSSRSLLAQADAAEHLGNFDEADELYAQAVADLDLQQAVEPDRGSLLQPTGMLYVHLGRRLEDTGLTEAAIRSYQRAVATGVAGPGLYPEAFAYEALLRLRERGVMSEQELEDAAFAGGKKFLWRGEAERAVALLQAATAAGPRLPLAGYYLAQALLVSSWPEGQPAPAAATVRAAETAWTDWLEAVGAPVPQDAWVYATGARIVAWLSLATDGRASWTWTQLLRAEKGISLNLHEANCWGLSIGALRELQLDGLALEGARYAADLDPEVDEPQHQMLAVLANNGHFDEAVAILERLKRRDTNPWLIGVRGWLRYHTGDYEGCVADMTLALRGGFDVGWNLDLRAAGLVALDRFEEAVEDLRRLLVEDVGFGVVGAIRRARALAILGQETEAAMVIESVDISDPRLDMVEYGAALVIVDACRGRATEAEQGLDRVMGAMSNQRERNDAVDNWREVAKVLRWRGVSGDSSHLLDRLADLVNSVSPIRSPSPAEELADAVAAHPDRGSVEGASLLAVSARRLAVQGDHSAAAEAYDLLTDGPFAPEAARALDAVLHTALTTAVRDGDAEAALRFHRRLQALGRSPYASDELLTAEMEKKNGLDDVRTALNRAVATASNETSQFAANLQLGETEALSGDYDAGLRSLTSALRFADESGDVYRAAQAHARLGALLIARHATDEGEEHLRLAMSKLSSAGLSNLSTALAIELRQASSEMQLSSSSDDLLAAYRAVTAEVDAAP
jgi:tetratricopeptide (TPR) repeat protein